MTLKTVSIPSSFRSYSDTFSTLTTFSLHLPLSRTVKYYYAADNFIIFKHVEVLLSEIFRSVALHSQKFHLPKLFESSLHL